MESDRTLQIEGSGIVSGLFGGGGCFRGDQLVWTPDGMRAIAGIRKGDRVYCFNSQRELCISVVKSTSVHRDYEVWRYGFWGGEVYCTPNHYFLTEGNAFQEIGKILRDEPLYNAQWQVLPLETADRVENADVFNFLVEGCHSYFVTEHKIAVHNGGGGGSKGQVAPDSSHSTATAYVVEILSSGVVEGLVGGAQGIYLNQTPFQNADGTSNFKAPITNDDGTISYKDFFTYDFRPGTQTQTYLPGYADEVANETGVGIEVKAEIPVTRSIINSQLDGIRVRISIQMQNQKSDGSVTGSSLRYQIYVKQGSGAFELRIDDTKSGKFSSPTEFEWYMPVNNFGGTVDGFSVKIVKVTPDPDPTSTSSTLQNTLQFVSYTQIIETKISYAHSCVIGLKFDPRQFNSIPSRQYKLAGILIQVPTNAIVSSTDRGLDFISPTWDGTFYTPALACADPAWIAYYLLTDPLNGLGKYINAPTIDKWSLYRCSVYNNQLIADGLGGTERRFLCNAVMTQREDAWKCLEAVFAAFNCNHYWADGTVYFSQDRPLDPGEEYKWQFTQADVEEGRFVYSSSALRSRSSVAHVTWNDPSNFYQQTVEPVEDPKALAKYGYREIEFAAFGCTSRGQAIRKGRYVLFSNNQETETVTFSTRSYGYYVRPGDIIQIADAKRAAIRYGGLIASATTIGVYLDSPIQILSSGYRITCMMPDGTLQTRNVTNGVGATQSVGVDVAFTQTPLPESNWVISAPNVLPQLYRVISNSSDPSDVTKHTITGNKWVPDKFNAIESGLSIVDRPTTQTIPTTVSAPRSPTIAPIVANGSPGMIVSWLQPLTSSGGVDPFTASYQVEHSIDYINWAGAQIVTTPNVTYNNLPPGTYWARVQAINVSGKASNFIYTNPTTIQVVLSAPKPITTEKQDFRNRQNSVSIFL